MDSDQSSTSIAKSNIHKKKIFGVQNVKLNFILGLMKILTEKKKKLKPRSRPKRSIIDNVIIYKIN